MIDREKVIKAFDDAKEEFVWLKDDEYTVGYNAGIEAGKNITLDLLKEQEAVKPLKSKLSFTHGFDWEIWDCGCCGNQLRSFAKYCDQCGKAVKWDE